MVAWMLQVLLDTLVGHLLGQLPVTGNSWYGTMGEMLYCEYVPKETVFLTRVIIIGNYLLIAFQSSFVCTPCHTSTVQGNVRRALSPNGPCTHMSFYPFVRCDMMDGFSNPHEKKTIH